MRKAILMVLLGVASSSVPAQIFAPSVAPSYWKPWQEVQTYAPDLVWNSDDQIPRAALDALPKSMTERDADGYRNWSYPVAAASVDLDGDGSDELIVRSGEPFSGGPEFAILQKSGNQWNMIGEIQGGFTISKRSQNGYANIETWSRHPETYHHLWEFTGGHYRTVRTEIGPWEDRAFDPPYVPD